MIGLRCFYGTNNLFWLLLAGWLAATVSDVAGFGGALLLLPVLTNSLGVQAAVPVLTIAQLLGNGSRVWFGRREIRWRPLEYIRPLFRINQRVLRG